MSALHSYRLLVTWQARRMRMFLPLGIVVQALFALGIVAGYPLLFPTIDRTTVLYLATGAPVLTVIPQARKVNWDPFKDLVPVALVGPPETFICAFRRSISS